MELDMLRTSKSGDIWLDLFIDEDFWADLKHLLLKLQRFIL